MLIHLPKDHNAANASSALALGWLNKNGLPQRKCEHWRMTPIQRLLSQEFSLAENQIPTDAQSAVADYQAKMQPASGRLIVLYHGVLVDELSDIDANAAGVKIGQSDQAKSVLDYARLPFAAQNISHNPASALTIDFTENQDKSWHILSLNNDQQASFTAVQISVAENVQSTLVESHISIASDTTIEKGYSAYSNSLVQIQLADKARFSHYKWQNLSAKQAHIAASTAEVGKAAKLDAFVLNMGGGLVRQDTEVAIVGSEAEAIINGAYIGDGKQHIDNTSQIKHLVPDSYSREVYKGVLSDQAIGVFQARILVDQIAQRTDAYQMNRALLLSSESEVSSKPELEIYADDVKCSHGATVGQLDKDQLFYLMARGIPRVQAQTLLIEAYLEDVFADMVDTELASCFAGYAREKLQDIAGRL